MTSVVIPVYNGRAILPTTVPAVLAMHEVDEVIWVDDGSSDGTGAWLCQALADVSRARILRLPTNSGRGAARNAGASASSGDTIVFLDADVEPAPDTGRALAEAAGAGSAIAAVARLDPAVTDPDEPYQDYAAHHRRGARMTGSNGAVIGWVFFLSGICGLSRAAFNKAGGFRTDIGYGEDTELGCRLSRLAPQGLRLADTTVRLHNVGTLSQALGHAAAFGRSLQRFDPDCRSRILGVAEHAPGAAIAARAVSPVLSLAVRRLPAGALRRRAVRYLLAVHILRACRG